MTADGENVQPPSIGWGLVLTAWWLSPLTLYTAACRTTGGAVVLGLGYLATVVMIQPAIVASTSSTAGIGLLTVPVLLWAGMAAAVTVEKVLNRLITNHADIP
jgi:hypothetical protein